MSESSLDFDQQARVRICVQNTWIRWALDKGDDENDGEDHSPTRNLTLSRYFPLLDYIV